MMARDAEPRRIAARILIAQAASTLIISALFLAFAGKIQALSALAGGTIGLIANAWMTLNMLRAGAGVAGALGRLMLGQLVKVVLTVALLVIVARGRWANWPALLVAYAATLVVYWFVPALLMRARKPQDERQV